MERDIRAADRIRAHTAAGGRARIDGSTEASRDRHAAAGSRTQREILAERGALSRLLDEGAR
jgi:hypothetical protein